MTATRVRTLMLALALVFAVMGIVQAARPDAEQKKIDYLIAELQRLDGATFIRNGSEYSAAKAADHLRTKLRHAGDRIQTARQFIDELGTKSSMSGETYRIRFDDGRVLDSAQVLNDRLLHYKP
ncbi:MAG TPA: DUF5329 family protein [Tahibacter sp.]|uniref:DUF5329 family protein n=1 Tax=Tahibacter sp. TaxID=2056211 RepID=UPI002C5F3D11|nr:DUF5329 family protein [Tahibacter sp.]HSX59803.1 DUF5329 family protein [Tahibacter sp.]